MNSQPLVSIMMPAYNAENTVSKAIKSLQLQTYENWECIVVNDGSTDNTSKIVNSFKDSRIYLINLEKNKGRGFARQVALESCNGSFISMLDSDDWYYPNKIEKQVDAFFDYPEVDVVSCLMAVVDKNGRIIGLRGEPNYKPILFNMPTTVPVPHASTMIRRKAIKEHSYDITQKYGQDMDFLRRVLLGKKYLLLDSVGYVYEEGYSNTFPKSFESYFYSIKAYSKFINDHPLFISKKMFLQYIKALRLVAYFSVGQYEKCIHDRSRKATSRQILEFDNYSNIINKR